MFLGLSYLEKEFYADNLHKAVLLAPCLILMDDLFGWGTEKYIEQYDWGVYGVMGPTWPEDYQTLCEHSDEYCEAYEPV